MPPGQPANPSKIPSDYYCRTQAVYQMDLTPPRARSDNASFCSGARAPSAGVIGVLKGESFEDKMCPRGSEKERERDAEPDLLHSSHAFTSK